MEQLTEEEKKALRGSKFAPLPSAPSSSRSQPRLAHPGGPMKTNKAAALAKFLERKLQDPNGLASLDPRLIEVAVKNAKHTVQSSGTSSTGRTVHQVHQGSAEEEEDIKISISKKSKKNKKRKKLKKEKQHKKLEEFSNGKAKKPKKQLKL
ncbi:nucleolar protein 58 isoform X1 [Nicotiana sylvestris]|uniref:Uncharacterized protein LOC104247576 isoform X1 n=1 Tax=Nicotiana sylvestris TaxID=4096 RepID=A0A1U7YFL5_NICSY|nr:PREDICTED: uncharacterized protein LOC104247576 isoform X1 [Nicotiana sylvestris]